MGRYINCKIDDQWEIVWKYGLGTQNSEMHRIYDELGIGDYYLLKYSQEGELIEVKSEEIKTVKDWEELGGDRLILTRNDLNKLTEQIEILKANGEDELYTGMIIAIRDFILEYPQKDTFILEGDF